MKILNKIKTSFWIAVIAFAGACLPESSDQDLGPKPVASFECVPVQDAANTYILKNTSEGSFFVSWKMGQGAFVEGTGEDTVYFGAKGDYEVTLRVLGPGGYDETTKTIHVEETDPNLCVGTPAKETLSILTGCGVKTWVLMPDAGALTVGPLGGGVWWSNGVADVTDPARTCLFNDEYTFTATGEFIFDDKGDFRVDDEGSAPWPTDIGLGIGCYDMSQIPSKYKAWGSGNHRFTNTENTLTVAGLGAHLGLYKVGENGTTAAPEKSITYEIVEITENRLVVRKTFDWGYWAFVLTPKE